MGTCSYVLTGTEQGMMETFGTTCHGAVSHISIISLVLKVSTHIITSITARPMELTGILVIMSISVFKMSVILYFHCSVS
jgi:hypothetical protein